MFQIASGTTEGVRSMCGNSWRKWWTCRRESKSAMSLNWPGICLNTMLVLCLAARKNKWWTKHIKALSRVEPLRQMSQIGWLSVMKMICILVQLLPQLWTAAMMAKSSLKLMWCWTMKLKWEPNTASNPSPEASVNNKIESEEKGAS